ncbi:MAG: hypothetical protein AAFP69_04075, partial [Planctomycetota bacterium]
MGSIADASGWDVRRRLLMVVLSFAAAKLRSDGFRPSVHGTQATQTTIIAMVPATAVSTPA